MNDQPKFSAPAPIAQAVVHHFGLNMIKIFCQTPDANEWLTTQAVRYGKLSVFDNGKFHLWVYPVYDVQETMRYIAQEIGAVIQ